MCSLCNESSLKKKFATNKTAEGLMKLDVDHFNFGEIYAKAASECKKLEASIESLRIFQKNPQDFIHAYVSTFKNLVNVRKEEVKNKIETLSEQMLKKLEAFEADCNENLKNVQTLDENTVVLKEAQAHLEEWNSDGKLLVSDEDRRKEIYSMARALDLKLHDINLKLSNELIMNKGWMHLEMDKLEEFSNELVFFEE